MKQNGIFLEPPRTLGKESEFFLQTANPDTVCCNAHVHSALELLYVNEGSYFVSLDGEEYEIRKGDLILICSGAIHHVRSLSDENNSYYVIKIPPTVFIDLTDREKGAAYSMRFSLHRKDQKFIWRANELEKTQRVGIIERLIRESVGNELASDVARSLVIMELLVDILRETPSASLKPHDACDVSIYHVMRYVREHFSDNIDEKALALDYGMSYSYFSRSFKRVTGMTFRSYLNRTRINHAEQMLCKNEGSVSEIALACGYNSISYFINVYRKLTGNTPYKFKKGIRE